MMDAYVTMRYRCSDLCDESDLGEAPFKTFENMVRWLIHEDGVLSIADDAGEVIAVEQTPARDVA